MTLFLDDGTVPIDNNASEREVKRVVLNRKNSLFVGNARGGRTAAILSNFTATCRRHGIDPPTLPNPVAGQPSHVADQRSRVRNVVLDTGAADFAERTADLAGEVLSQGSASAVSCVGVGSGSMRWSEEELQRLEVGVVGAFAHGCHDGGIAQFCLLSAVGSTARDAGRWFVVVHSSLFQRHR